MVWRRRRHAFCTHGLNSRVGVQRRDPCHPEDLPVITRATASWTPRAEWGLAWALLHNGEWARMRSVATSVILSAAKRQPTDGSPFTYLLAWLYEQCGAYDSALSSVPTRGGFTRTQVQQVPRWVVSFAGSLNSATVDSRPRSSNSNTGDKPVQAGATCGLCCRRLALLKVSCYNGCAGSLPVRRNAV